MLQNNAYSLLTLKSDRKNRNCAQLHRRLIQAKSKDINIATSKMATDASSCLLLAESPG